MFDYDNELVELVDELMDNPTSFIAMAKLNEYINVTPKDKVSSTVLEAQIDRLTPVSPAAAYKLLSFAVDIALT